MLTEQTLKEYYEKGWELGLLALCDDRVLRTSPFKYRIQTVVDLVRGGDRPPARVLDMGCGVGTTSILLARRYPAARFTCVDISAVQMQAGADYVRRAGLTDRFEFIVSDVGQPLPGSRPPFDWVIACEIIEHLPRPEALLATVREAGTAATRYVFSVPIGTGQNDDIMYRIPGPNGDSRVIDDPERLPPGATYFSFYHKLYGAAEARALFTRTGYVVERAVGVAFMHGTRLGQLVHRLTGHSCSVDRVLNRVSGGAWADNVIFVCRRA